MGFQHIFDQFIGRSVTDGYEYTFARDVGNLAGFGMLYFHTLHAKRQICAINFVDLVEPQGHNFFVLH